MLPEEAPERWVKLLKLRIDAFECQRTFDRENPAERVQRRATVAPISAASRLASHCGIGALLYADGTTQLSSAAAQVKIRGSPCLSQISGVESGMKNRSFGVSLMFGSVSGGRPWRMKPTRFVSSARPIWWKAP